MKRATRKLSLNREAVRTLTGIVLSGVRGGDRKTDSPTCGNGCTMAPPIIGLLLMACMFVMGCATEDTATVRQATVGICTLPNITGESANCAYQQEAAQAQYVAEQQYSANPDSLTTDCWHVTGHQGQPDHVECEVQGFYWYSATFGWTPAILICTKWDWFAEGFVDGCMLSF